LIARVGPEHRLKNVARSAGERESRILEGVFLPGDRWFVTGDLLRRDADGDYWFVDRLSDVIRTSAGPVHARDRGLALSARRRGAACVYPLGCPAKARIPVAALVPRRGRVLDISRMLAHLEPSTLRMPPRGRARARPCR
jgi:acyl-CoA synthetase (AMP-forming)/AMP-acid ligase II